MSYFEAKTLCILGRQPKLGLAELESLYGPEHIRPAGEAALLDIPAGDINFMRLGGTIKVAQILEILDINSWSEVRSYLLKVVPEHLMNRPEGKFTLGLSLYGFSVPANDINKTALAIKKASGRSLRVVPNKTAALSSAQVLHNKLTRRGAWELILFKDGDRTILAQTFFVQDIEAYAARDQARPARDARVGMLPPKLAQIIINLAMRAPERRDKPERLDRYLVLDPFCGTGVILQEALLMGYSAVGTDNSDKMVEYTKANMKWLYQNHPGIVGYTNVELGDATDHKWQIFSAMASETYLGRPLTKLPSPPELNKIVSDVNTILTKFLANLAKQNKEQRRICLAIPAWQIGPNKFKTLPVLDKLTDMGYNVLKFKHVGAQDLFYFRENQIVARQLIVLGRDLKEITR